MMTKKAITALGNREGAEVTIVHTTFLPLPALTTPMSATCIENPGYTPMPHGRSQGGVLGVLGPPPILQP